LFFDRPDSGELAVLVHLDHAKGYRDPALMAQNKNLRKQVERERITRTDFGIQQLVDTGYTADAGSTQ